MSCVIRNHESLGWRQGRRSFIAVFMPMSSARLDANGQNFHLFHF
jgi:hypothetical protein